MSEKVPDYELPSSKPEIWWAIKKPEAEDIGPQWQCVVVQNWSKAREAFPPDRIVARASRWREVIERPR